MAQPGPETLAPEIHPHPHPRPIPQCLQKEELQIYPEGMRGGS